MLVCQSVHRSGQDWGIAMQWNSVQTFEGAYYSHIQLFFLGLQKISLHEFACSVAYDSLKHNSITVFTDLGETGSYFKEKQFMELASTLSRAASWLN